MPLSLSLRYTFPAPPERIWPIVADTERLNRALGLPEMVYEPLAGATEVNRRAVRAAQRGVLLSFEEEPFEWVENEFYHVTRTFPNGPFRSFCGGTTLAAAGGGTEMHVWAEFEPRSKAGGLLFRAIHFKTVRDWDRLAQRIRERMEDEARPVYGPRVDTAPAEVAQQVAQSLRDRGSGLAGAPLAPRLFAHLAEAGDVDLERIRPFRLARRWAVDRYEVLRLCLRAAREGVLDLSWDLLCPNCRGGDIRVAHLSEVRRRAHCESCHITYDANFDRYVEVTFRPNPRCRKITPRIYCVAGPRVTPHILVQVVLEPGEEQALRPSLAPGHYRLRTLTGSAAALVEAGEYGGVGVGEYGSGPDLHTSIPPYSPTLHARLTPDGLAIEPEGGAVTSGHVCLELRNDTQAPAQVVLEKAAWDADCATAAMVSVFQEFRDLFGSEVLAPDVQLGIESLPIVFTDLKGSTDLYQRLGDAAAYALVRDHFRFLQEAVEKRGGGIIKTIGDAVMAAFPTAAAAVEAALAIQENVETFHEAVGRRELAIKIGVHQGPCIAVRANDGLDYFGRTVNFAARLHDESQGGDVVLSEALFNDPAVARLLEGCQVVPFEARLKGIPDPQRLWRVRPGEGD